MSFYIIPLETLSRKRNIKTVGTRLLCIFILFSTFGSLYASDGWIRINQLGYSPNAIKVAVLISEEDIRIEQFQLRNAIADTVVYRGKTKEYPPRPTISWIG